MKKRILMLGAGFMQGVAIRAARERGWEVIAVDGNPEAVCRNLADAFEPIDLKDIQSLSAFALKLRREGGLDAVFTAATDFSASVAAVAQACGLSGHSYEAALNASDKLRMRDCFEKANVPSPRFVGIDQSSRSRVRVLMQGKKISLPVVVKPVDNMGARGCRKVENESSLDEAIGDAIRYSRSGNVIVEEFMDGPEFSVEALVYDGGIHMTGIADRHIFFPPYFIEMGHTIPSCFSEGDIASIVSAFKKGVASLGLTSGVAKGDVKLTKNGPMIGEIAGRLSGGYMSGWTFPYSSGIDLTGAALELAAGIRPVSLIPGKNWTSAERAWISIPGRVASVSGYEKARALPYVKDIFPRSYPGDFVSFPLNNVEKCGNCLSSAPERSLAVNAAEEGCRLIFLRLEPSNPATDAFLLSGAQALSPFPPDAFVLPSDFPADISAGGVAYRPLQLDTGNGKREKIEISIPALLFPHLDSVKDWQGRTLRQALTFVCEMEPNLVPVLNSGTQKDINLYFKALLRGGIQGIVYVYDCAAI